jgi:hypothetical protein
MKRLSKTGREGQHIAVHCLALVATFHVFIEKERNHHENESILLSLVVL